MATRLGLLGGSFNPIHFGHLIGARAVAEQLELSRITLIPAAAPPHKKQTDIAPAHHRLAMVRLAVDGDLLFDVNDLELSREGPSYTFDTLMALRARFSPDTQLFWLIGGDTLGELESWHRISELVHLAEIVTMARPGSGLPDAVRLQSLVSKIGPAAVQKLLDNRLTTPMIEISATDIRRRASLGRSIRYLVPENVAGYIAEHGLYRPREDGK